MTINIGSNINNKKTIVIGCGRIGAEVAMRLSEQGYDVAIVDERKDAFDRLGQLFHGRMIEGSALDYNTLVRAGIGEANIMAIVTPNDNVNIILARIARAHFNVPRVIASLYDPRKIETYRALGIQYVSMAEWVTHRLQQLLCHPLVTGVLSLGSGEVEVVEVHVMDRLAGSPISEVLKEGEITLVSLTRGGHAHIPPKNTLLEKGDILHLSVIHNAIPKLETFLEEEGATSC